MLRLLVNKQFLKIVAMVVLVGGLGWVTLRQVIRADENIPCADEGTTPDTCESTTGFTWTDGDGPTDNQTDNPLPGGETTSAPSQAPSGASPVPGASSVPTSQPKTPSTAVPGTTSTPNSTSTGLSSPSAGITPRPTSSSGATSSGQSSSGSQVGSSTQPTPPPYVPNQVILKWDNPPVEYKVALTHFGDKIPAKYSKKALDLSPSNRNQVVINPPSPLTGLFGIIKAIFDR